VKIARSRASKPFPSLAPLVDIVFQLLIFFMLTSAVSVADLFDVKLPESTTAGEQSLKPVIVLVGSEGKVALDGEIVRVEELIGKLQQRREAGAVPVMVKADREANTGDVVSVLEQIQGAGVEKVMLATSRNR